GGVGVLMGDGGRGGGVREAHDEASSIVLMHIHGTAGGGPSSISIVTQGIGPNDSWTEQLRRGGLELAILLVVAPGTRYGLEIIRHLQAFTDLVVTEGTIYPILGRLTRDGMLEAEWQAPAPPPRQNSRPSSAGRPR